MRRVLVVGGVAIVVVLGVALYLAWSSLDALVEAAIERFGSDATGTRVRLDGVELRPTEGSAALRGFTVGNPGGFGSPHAFELGEISVKLDVATVTQDEIVIRQILVDAPSVTFELSPTGSNIAAIQRNVESYTGGAAGSGGKPAESSAAEAGPRFVIEDLHIRGGTVRVVASGLGTREVEARLPDIRVRNLGRTGAGVTAAQVISRIMLEVNRGVGRAVAQSDLESTLRQAGDREALEALLRERGGGAAGTVKGALEEAGRSLKGILGGDR